MEAAQTYGDVYASSRDGGGRYTNKQMAEYVAKAASAKAALETYVALLEQTRDAAQAAGTKAVKERRLAEEEARHNLEDACRLEDELKAIRELIATHGKDRVYDWHFTCVCGKQLDWMGGADSNKEALDLATVAAVSQGWVCRPGESLLICSPACVAASTRHHRERVESIERWVEETGRDKCPQCGAKCTLACPRCEVGP